MRQAWTLTGVQVPALCAPVSSKALRLLLLRVTRRASHCVHISPPPRPAFVVPLSLQMNTSALSLRVNPPIDQKIGIQVKGLSVYLGTCIRAYLSCQFLRKQMLIAQSPISRRPALL